MLNKGDATGGHKDEKHCIKYQSAIASSSLIGAIYVRIAVGLNSGRSCPYNINIWYSILHPYDMNFFWTFRSIYVRQIDVAINQN